MTDFDIQETLKQSAVAYYRADYELAGMLLKGCLRRLSLLPLEINQVEYLNQLVTQLNAIVQRYDYVALADVINYELIQNFPDIDTLLESSTN